MNKISNKYKYNTADLCKALGISRMTLITWEKKGYISTPRIGLRGDRRFTQKQLNEIVREFSPGGIKRWFFEPDKPTK